MNERSPEHRTNSSTVRALILHVTGHLGEIGIMRDNGLMSETAYQSARQHLVNELNHLRRLPRDLTEEQAEALRREHHTRADDRRNDFKRIKGA